VRRVGLYGNQLNQKQVYHYEKINIHILFNC